VRAGAARDRILLDYEGTLLSPNVRIDDVAVAPDVKRLAIVLSRVGDFLWGVSELFVISLVDGDPIARSLGGPAYDVSWTPNGAALLAVSKLPGTADTAIYRWDM
jgi:hypothetical protein